MTKSLGRLLGRGNADPSTSLRFAQDDNFFELGTAANSLERAWR
jgi:hypothetical protein